MQLTRLYRAALAACVVLFSGGCSTGLLDTSGNSQSAIRVINATQAPIDVIVSGQVIYTNIKVADVSPAIVFPSGSFGLAFRSSAGTTTEIPVGAGANQLVTAVAYKSTTSDITAGILNDTGSVAPADKSKLRVVNLASNAASIEIWRTQPDFQTPVHIMTPFPYLESSPYLQSTPGDWEVFVTPAGSTTKLATTGAVTIGGGARRTAILLDSAGVFRFRVLAEP